MIVFLDFDGVLHPNEDFLKHPLHHYQRRGIVLECDGHSLFEHVGVLEEILEPHPQAKIVLSTSWVVALGFNRAKGHLPTALQNRVIGATYHSAQGDRNWWWGLTRHEQIARYVRRHNLHQWIAIDDDECGWPENQYHRLVHTDEWAGLGQAAAQSDLAAKLVTMI